MPKPNNENTRDMSKTFPIGGVHPSDNKISRGAAIESMPLPKRVVIPLAQHIGAPATAIVAKGDKVVVGQKIGQSGGFVSSNIHSSVSGSVVSVEAIADGSGIKKPSIVIDVEGDEWDTAIDRSNTLIKECTLDAKEIVARITEAGIVGMGGATFPAHVKLSPPPGKSAEFLIINGVECEPYLTADHRVMLEHGEELMVGISILARALNVKKSYIGIEKNKPDAIKHLAEIAKEYPSIEVVPLKVHYPQGGEKQLIAAITGRQVPSGALPIEVGAVVQNVGTTLAVYQAVQKHKPLFERVVTVTGKHVTKPSNLLVRIGTPISALIEYAGGMGEHTGKVICGGPMMGRAMCNLDAPVTKGTSGVLLMSESDSLRPESGACVRCGKCVAACPMGLEPYMLVKYSQKKMWQQAEEEHIADCIECGCCIFSCPSNLPILDYVRLGKAEVMKIMRARTAKK